MASYSSKFQQWREMKNRAIIPYTTVKKLYSCWVANVSDKKKVIKEDEGLVSPYYDNMH